MRSCDATPLGETFRDARVRAMVLALLMKSPWGGCVESVVTFATQRLFFACRFFLRRHRTFISRRGLASPQLHNARKGLGLVVLKILHCFLMRLGRAPGGECSKIPPFSGLGILLARVQTIFPGFEFPNHRLDCLLLHALLRLVRLAFTAAL